MVFDRLFRDLAAKPALLLVLLTSKSPLIRVRGVMSSSDAIVMQDQWRHTSNGETTKNEKAFLGLGNPSGQIRKQLSKLLTLKPTCCQKKSLFCNIIYLNK